MHRLFVAIDFPPAIRDRLIGLCRGVPGARWVPPEQLHLTLRFIGEVDGPTFHDVAEALDEIHLPRFELRLKGVGHFPPGGEPRVLWAGVAPSDTLSRLRGAVERAVIEAGVAPDARRFTPHVTLARLKGARGGEVAPYLAEHSLFAGAPFQVGEFHLYSSWLGTKRAQHRIEASYPLFDPVPADYEGEPAGGAPD